MSDDPWGKLCEAYPWPPERPKVTGPHVHRIHGWLSDGTKKMIRSGTPRLHRPLARLGRAPHQAAGA